MIQAQLKGYVRKRNTSSKITDVKRLVLEAKESITPEAWAACVRHVVDQEKYFMEMDSKLEVLDDEEWEDVEEGTLDEVLAPEVAMFHYQNPSSSSKLESIFLVHTYVLHSAFFQKYLL